MFGKHFESMYEGSMVGAGAMVFAVMGYIIAKWKPERAQGGKVIGGHVRLNPELLGPILGESPKEVEKAIEYLCSPDKKTSTPGENGRRLIRIGQFDYRVVNAVKYHELRTEEQRKEQNRLAQERFRDKKKTFDELSEEEQAIVMKALDKEKKRRTKKGAVYSADLKSVGKMAGAQSAIVDGLKQAATPSGLM